MNLMREGKEHWSGTKGTERKGVAWFSKIKGGPKKGKTLPEGVRAHEPTQEKKKTLLWGGEKMKNKPLNRPKGEGD